MRLRTLKVWLFLLPIIGFIGVVLFVQSNKNITELENQHLRSVEAIRNDILLALPDYYSRIEGYFLREAYALSENQEWGKNSKRISDLLASFQPQIDSIRLVAKKDKYSLHWALQGSVLTVKNLELNIDQEAIDRIDITRLREKFDLNYLPKPKAILVDFRVELSELLRKQENNQVFEDFFLTDEAGRVVFPSSALGQQIHQPEVLVTDSLDRVRTGVYYEEIDYSGTQSRFYVAPMPLGELQLFAVGVIPQSRFLKVGLRLDFALLSTLIFMLIILVASVPILGILNLSKGDNLTQAKVLQVGVSLLGLTMILGFAIPFFKNQPQPVAASSSDRLEIRDALQKTLSSYDHILTVWQLDPLLCLPGPPLNELILFDPIYKGKAERIFFQSPRLNLRFPDGNSPIDLSSRAYYEFFEVDSNLQNNKKFLNSHYSRGSGKLESVISKPNSQKQIAAVTFELESPRHLSQLHRYLLMKEDGSILYKSEKIISPISNLKEGVSEESWVEIHSLIQSNDSLKQMSEIEVPLYLNGNHYTGVLSKIPVTGFDQNMWMLFLVNHNVSHVFSSLTSLEAVCLLMIYFLFVLLNLILQKFSRDLVSDYGFRLFFFDWLKPNQENRGKLKYLSICYLIYSLLVLVIYKNCQLNHLQWLALMIFSSSLIAFTNLTLSIPSKKPSSSPQMWISSKAFPSILLSLLLGIACIWGLQLPPFPIFILLLAAVLIVSFWPLIERKNFQFSFLMPSKVILPSFLTVWFLVIGLIPGYLIQSKTQLFEHQIWKESQIDTSTEPNRRAREFEQARRSLMVQLTDPFDQKIQNFIAPNQQTFQQAWLGTSQNLKANSGLIYIFLILALMGALMYYLQRIIFFSFERKYEDAFDSAERQLFICSIDSTHLEEIIEKVFSDQPEEFATIDFLVESLGWEFQLDETKDVYILKNFHCLDTPTQIIPILERLHEMDKKIWICSGKQWWDIFTRIDNPADRMRFSESFSDYNFKSLPIRHDSLSIESEESKADSLLKQLRLRKAFYANMWSEMSFEEKIVTAAFAKEGFFNLHRKEILIGLAQKGILIPKTSSSGKSKDVYKEWQLFSPVFRKYILDHSTEEEKAAFKAYERKNGNANSIQISLISFVLICFALIGIFDKNFFSETYTYLTGSLGIMGSLYALIDRGIGSFKFGKNSSTT